MTNSSSIIRNNNNNNQRSKASLCKLVHGFASFTNHRTPDGLYSSTHTLTDFSWLDHACTTWSNDANTNGLEFSYDSGWMALSSSPSSLHLEQTFLPNSVTVQSAQLRRQILMQFHPESDTVDITLMLNLKSVVQGSVAGVKLLSPTTLEYTMSKRTGSPLLFSAIPYFPVGWEGSMMSPETCSASSSNSGICFFDINLFDGVDPFIIDKSVASSSAEVSTHNNANNIAASFMYLATQFGVHAYYSDLSPFSLKSSAVRGVFLNSTKIIDTTMSKSETNSQHFASSKLYRPQTNSFSELGDLFQTQVSCIIESGTNSSSCIDSTLIALNDLLKEAIQSSGKSCDLSHVPETYKSSLTAMVFISQDKLYPLGFSGDSQVVMECDSRGHVGIRINIAAGTTGVWPLQLFTDSIKSATTLIRSVPLQISGYVLGRIEDSNENSHSLFTSLPNNIFSSNPGGFFVRDYPFTQDTITTLVPNLMQQMKAVLHTNVKYMDDACSQLFDEQKAKQAAQFYIDTETPFPSVLGFLHFFANQHADIVSLLVQNDEKAYFDFSMVKTTDQIIRNDHTITRINVELTTLYQKFIEQFMISYRTTKLIDGSTTLKNSLFSGALTSVMVVENIFTNISVMVDPRSSPSFNGALSLSAIFDTSNVFTEIYATFDYSTGKVTIKGSCNYDDGSVVYATLNEKGELVYTYNNGFISPVTISGYVSTLVSKIDDLHNINKTLPMIENTFTMATQQYGIETVLNMLSRTLSTLGNSMDIINLSMRIEQFFNLFCQSENCQSVLLASTQVQGSSISLNLVVHNLQKFKLVDGALDILKRAPTMGAATQLTLSVKAMLSASPSFTQFTIKGKSIQTGFMIPLRYNMQSGTLKEGIISFDIDMPNSVKFSAKLNFNNELSQPLTVQIESGNLLSVGAIPSVEFSGDGNVLFVPNQAVFSNMKDIAKVLTQLNNGPLNFRVPFLDASLSVLHNWDDFIDNTFVQVPYPKTKTSQGESLLTLIFSETQNSIPDLNITVNGRIYPCPINSIDPQNKLKSINIAFSQCGLGEVLIAKESAAIVNAAGIHSMVDNSLFELIFKYVDFTSTEQTLEYHAPFYPCFSSWGEVSWLVHILTRVPFSPHQFINIPTNSLQIPERMMRVFPPQLTAASIEFKLNEVFTSSSNIISSVESSQNKVSLQTKGTVNVENHIDFSGKFGTVFSLPGLYNISILSCATNDFTIDTIITNASYEFTLLMEVQQRFDGQHSQSLTSKITFKLPTGRTFKDIMMNVLPLNIDEAIRPMFSVGVYEGSETFGSLDQIQISLKSFQKDDLSYLLPISMSISDSSVPILCLASQIPPTSMPITSGIKIQSKIIFKHSDDGPISLSSGSIGIFDIESTSSDSALSGAGTLNLDISLNKDVVPSFNVLRASTNSTTMFNIYDINIASNGRLTLPNPSIKARSDLPPLDSLSLSSNKMWKVSSSEILDKISMEIHKLETTFTSSVSAVKETYIGLSQTNATSLCSFLDSIMQTTDKIGRQSLIQAPLPFVQRSLKHLLESTIVNKFSSAKQSVCNGIVEFSIGKFCDLLQHAWGQKVCYDVSVGDKKFLVTLKLLNYPLISNEGLYVKSNVFGDSTLPSILGTKDSISLNSNANFEIHLACSWSNGISFEILDGTSFYIDTHFKMNGNLKASLGPLNLMLASADVFIGSPTALSIYLKNGAIDYSLSGNAGFDAMVSFFDLSACQLSINVPNIENFLNGAPNAWIIDQHTCPSGSFSKTVNDLLQDHSLLDFFKDPSTFIAQWESNFSELIKRLFMGPNGLIQTVAVPLIDKEIQKIIQKEFTNLIGPEMTNELVVDITQMVNDIMQGKTPKFDSIEQFILDEFTKILCDKLQPVQCPPAPNVHSDQYEWKFEIKRLVKHSIVDIHFDLGASSKGARLQSQSELESEIDYDFRFNLIFSKTKGILVTFEDGYVIKGVADLKIDNALLEGELGFIGAEIIADPQSDFHAEFGVNSDWTSFFTVNAILAGKAELGFAGIIKKLLKNVQDPLDALPHFEMTIEFKWSWEMGKSTSTTPKFSISEPTLCIGTFLARMADGARKQAEKVLSNLDKILGPNAFLTKEVPVLSRIFGRKMNVAELGIFLAKHFCSGSCDAINVEEIIDAYNKLYYLMNKLQVIRNFLSTMNGCGIRRKFSQFIADLEKPEDPVLHVGDLPDQNLIFDDNVPPNMKIEISSTWSNIETRSYSFHVPLFENPKAIPSAVMGLIFGKDFDLVEIVLPRMVMSYSAHFGFPIWDWPYVELYIEASAGLVIDLPTLAYSTKGIRDAIQTKQITNLVRGMGMITRKPDGSPLWIVSGYARLTGGVSVSVFIFKGSAYAFLQANAGVTILDINGNQMVTFDELFYLISKYGVLNTVTFQMEISAGFGFNIQACIHVWFVHKCWTIVSQEIKVPVFPKITFGGKTMAPVADKNSNLNLAHVSEYASTESNPSVFRIYPTSLKDASHVVGFTTPSGSIAQNAPPLTAPNRGASSIGFYGNPGSNPFEIHVQGYQGLVTIPPLDTVTPRISLNSFKKSSSFSISPTFITPNIDGMGIQFTPGRCSRAILEEPDFGTSFNLKGSPCTISLSVAQKSQVFIDSQAVDYRGPLHISGPGELTVTIPSSQYQLSSSSITLEGNNNFIQLQNDMPVINVFAQNQPSIFTIDKVAMGSSITAVGGESDDQFHVTDLAAIQGSLYLSGGSGGINLGTVSINVPAGYSEIFATSSSISLGRNHTVRWTNLEHRKYNIVNKNDGSIVTVSYFSPDDFNSVHVATDNSPQGAIYHNISSCQTRNEFRLDLKGGGDQVVFISQNGELSSLQCSMYIQGVDTNNEAYTVVIDARNEKRPLRYAFENGRITVDDPINTDFMTNIYLRQISRLQIHFSEKQYSEIRFIQGSIKTEYYFSFPDTFSTPDVVPTVSICATAVKSTILISGKSAISIGPKQGVCSHADANPLANVMSMIAISGSSQITNVDLWNYNNNGNQHFSMNDRCLIGTDSFNGKPLTQVESPTSWMQSLLNANGFSNTLCQVAYNPHTSSFNIKTGSGDDTFVTRGVTASSLAVDLGDGKNNIFHAETNTPSSYKTGNGASKFVEVSPSGSLKLTMLSVPTKRNIIEFFTGNFASSMYGNTIDNIGPNPQTDIAQITCSRFDLITLHHSYPSNYKPSSDTNLRGGKIKLLQNEIRTVWVNVTETSTTRQIELSTDTVFKVSQIGFDSNIVFLGVNQAGSFATNWIVNIDLPDYSTPSRIFIDTKPSTNGTILANVKENGSIQNYPLRLLSDTPINYAVLNIGVFHVEALGVRNLRVNSKEEPIHAVVESTPDTLETVFDFTSGSKVRVKSMSGSLVVNDADVTVESNSLSKTLVVNGPSSTITIQTSTNMVLNAGCLKPADLSINNVPSEWLTSILEEFSIDSVAFKCSMFTNFINLLDISAPSLVATNIDKLLKSLFVRNSVLTLIDNQAPWSDVTLTNNTLSIDSRYEVTLVNTHTFINSTFSVSSMITFVGDVSDNQNPVQMHFNHFSPKQFALVEWNTTEYHIYVNPSSNYVLPNIYILNNVLSLATHLSNNIPVIPSSGLQVVYERDSLKVSGNSLTLLNIVWYRHPLNSILDVNGKIRTSVTFQNHPFNDNYTFTIQSSKGSDTLLNIIEPEEAQGFLDMTMNGATWPGLIQIGGMYILCSPDRISFNMLSHVTTILNGVPGNAEILFRSEKTSYMEMESVVNNMIMSNVIVDVNDNLLNHDYLLLVTGNNIETTLNSNMTSLEYDSGCILRTNRNHSVIMSSWFQEALKQYSISYPSLSQCSLFLLDTYKFRIQSVQNTILRNLNSKVNVREVFVERGQVSLFDDSNSWSDVSFNSTSLKVDTLFKLFVTQGMSISVINSFAKNSHLFASRDDLNGVDSPQHQTTFVFNCHNGNFTLLSWNQFNHKGMICNPSTTPFITFSNGSTPLNLNISLSKWTMPNYNSSQYITTAIASSKLVAYQNNKQPFIDISWSNPDHVSLNVLFSDQNYDIRIGSDLVPSNFLPNIQIMDNSKATLSLPTASSARFLKSSFDYDASIRAISNKKSLNDECLLPKIQCSSQFWEDIHVFGRDGYLSKPLYDACLSTVIVNIQTLQPFSCSIQSNSTMLTLPNMNTQYLNYPATIERLVYAWYSISVIGGSILFVLFGYLDVGQTSFLGAAMMDKVTSDTSAWSFNTRALIDACKDAVQYLGTGWISDDMTAIHLAPHFTLYAITVLSICVTIGLVVFRKKIQENKYFKIAISLFKIVQTAACIVFLAMFDQTTEIPILVASITAYALLLLSLIALNLSFKSSLISNTNVARFVAFYGPIFILSNVMFVVIQTSVGHVKFQLFGNTIWGISFVSMLGLHISRLIYVLPMFFVLKKWYNHLMFTFTILLWIVALVFGVLYMSFTPLFSEIDMFWYWIVYTIFTQLYSAFSILLWPLLPRVGNSTPKQSEIVAIENSEQSILTTNVMSVNQVPRDHVDVHVEMEPMNADNSGDESNEKISLIVNK
ncbi:hypothetical protein FDP41_005715 [Naegleria fowleri]|uniref:Uncharacterized protein n=1 Tax=Naegleria fowleri TaxID=5763 RepID=A0A6A5BJB2_NAEFO|nr:uncharacterized protein FDP41_005715 [Naegleria fowleri]KAF0974962.1 hypothetical protein FDP41_005715 [Naegleria fowleri]